MSTIEELKLKVLEGREVSLEEALDLSETEEREALYETAGEITRHFGKPAYNNLMQATFDPQIKRTTS